MFEFEPGLIIWTSVSFGLLVLLLYRVALPPLLALLEKREGQIAAALAESAASQQQAKALLEEHKIKLAEFHHSAEKIMAETKSEAEKARAEILDKANREAGRVLEKTQLDLAREKERIMAEAKATLLDLVAAAASRVLRRSITPEDNRRIIIESLDEVKQ
ncbi:MAG: F0F1 ATP synthase subunit B [Candidatus Margulisbacteria bacterium]|nr:F0F1 ATP synthase subunit B [Candidatus Margulisiibacteriota bacterium]